MRANDMRAKVLMLLCLLAAAPTHAEMSGADYESGAGALSADEREALRRKLADEIAAERARAAAAAPPRPSVRPSVSPSVRPPTDKRRVCIYFV